MRWLRLLWRAQVDPEEARQVLAQLRERDPEVAHLHRELREAEQRNHFSEMVAIAISRTRSA